MAEKKDVKKIYADFEKKYKLPEFGVMESEFEISAIEPGDNEKLVLREIRRRMHDKIEAVLKVLDGILQPEATLQNMYEGSVFTDEEKKKIYLLYKELASSSRASIVLEVQCSDEADAKFIREFADRWKKSKLQVIDIFKKLEESWKKESDIEEKLGYFG